MGLLVTFSVYALDIYKHVYHPIARSHGNVRCVVMLTGSARALSLSLEDIIK